MDNPAQEAAAAARQAKKQNAEMSNAVRGGQPIGQCPDCGSRFGYGRSADTSNMDPCPECGSRDWHKWGYRKDGEEIRRDEAWDRYDRPPLIHDRDGGTSDIENTGREQSGGSQ